jgi:hypothetical protein
MRAAGSGSVRARPYRRAMPPALARSAMLSGLVVFTAILAALVTAPH